MAGVSYFNQIVDDNGYTHSIDNVVATYSGYFKIDKVLDQLHEIVDKYHPVKFYELLNRSACVRYDFFLHHLHLDCIYIKLGKYKARMIEQSKAGAKREYDIFSVLRIEFNPNKHWNNPLVRAVLEIIKGFEFHYSSQIDKIDYAVDIPAGMSDFVFLNKSGKQHNYVNGTHYFGKRSQNGSVKVYDKKSESGLDYELTRVETTLRLSEKFSGLDFAVRTGYAAVPDDTSKTVQLYVDMLKDIDSLGGDINVHLANMPYRTRLQVEQYVHGDLVMIDYDSAIRNALIRKIERFLMIEGIQDIDDAFALLDDPSDSSSGDGFDWMDSVDVPEWLD